MSGRASFVRQLTIAIVVLAWLSVSAPRIELRAEPRSGHLAVTTESEAASRAALDILEHGGSAADAAVTAALVGGVASPASSGLGGGGFAVVFDARSRKVITLDFRETSPESIDAGAYDRRPLPAGERGKLVGIPGELAGLSELHDRFGRKPWQALVEPAARIAAQGYEVSPYVSKEIVERSALIALDPILTSLFAPGGRAHTMGERLRNPRLAKTLRQVSQRGARAFYSGETARDLVESARRQGSTLTALDLSRYKPVERAPIHVKWEGLDVYTMAPPSAGGLMLAQTLGAVTRKDVRRFAPESTLYQHFLAELLRGALADRIRFVGDPNVTPMDMGFLLSSERLGRRRQVVSLDRTHALPRFMSEEQGTHHIVTADADGNVVSLTTTINHGFGAGISAPETGVLLNDELDDFTATASARKFGVRESPNRARPNIRPVSSMAPTLIMKDGAPILALGASGGFTIGPAVVQVILDLLAFDMDPEKALGLPRFEIPTDGHTIALEPSVPGSFADGLRSRGEVPIMKQSVSTPAVQLMVLTGGKKTPFADPRKHGVALAR